MSRETVFKPGWLADELERTVREPPSPETTALLKRMRDHAAERQKEWDKPCYAPATWCVTHGCWLSSCIAAKRCRPEYEFS